MHTSVKNVQFIFIQSISILPITIAISRKKNLPPMFLNTNYIFINVASIRTFISLNISLATASGHCKLLIVKNNIRNLQGKDSKLAAFLQSNGLINLFVFYLFYSIDDVCDCLSNIIITNILHNLPFHNKKQVINVVQST